MIPVKSGKIIFLSVKIDITVFKGLGYIYIYRRLYDFSGINLNRKTVFYRTSCTCKIMFPFYNCSTVTDSFFHCFIMTDNISYSGQKHTRQYRTIDIKRDSKTKTPSQKAESIGRSIQITSHRHTESDRRRKSVSQIQIRQCEHNIQFGSLFSQTSVSCFSIPKNIFYN